MNRRKFIKTAGLAVGATLLSGIGLAGVTAEKTKSMKIVVLTGSPRLNGNTNHMASQFIKGAAKQAAFIMAYADTDPKEAEPIVSHYKTLLNYLGWKDRGMVIAPGMWPAGAVQNTQYSRQAYELGKSL